MCGKLKQNGNLKYPNSLVDFIDFESNGQAIWGFLLGNKPIINARNENINSSNLWKRMYRIVIPVSSFEEKGATFRFDEECYLAGLYMSGHLAVVTQESFGICKSVHHRMPIPMSVKAVKEWYRNGIIPNAMSTPKIIAA